MPGYGILSLVLREMMKTKITAEVIMSVEQYQKSVNTLDKEIATLEKKKVEADKKCADIQSKINSIRSVLHLELQLIW